MRRRYAAVSRQDRPPITDAFCVFTFLYFVDTDFVFECGGVHEIVSSCGHRRIGDCGVGLRDDHRRLVAIGEGIELARARRALPAAQFRRHRYLTTPGKAKVDRTKHDLHIDCDKNGYLPAHAVAVCISTVGPRATSWRGSLWGSASMRSLARFLYQSRWSSACRPSTPPMRRTERRVIRRTGPGATISALNFRRLISTGSSAAVPDAGISTPNISSRDDAPPPDDPRFDRHGAAR